MTANEWLKAELKKEYDDKAEAVYSAILGCRPIQFSSPEAQAKFEAILKEWNSRSDAEMPDEDHDVGQYEASVYSPRRKTGDPLAEYRRLTELSDAEKEMYVNNPQK